MSEMPFRDELAFSLTGNYHIVDALKQTNTIFAGSHLTKLTVGLKILQWCSIPPQT